MAAGLGFKTFTTGEVLTAADTNGYLMQGINVFANATARDAAITSPQEGQFAYLKDTNVTTYYTGSAWTNLDTTGMVNPMTTTGDTIYSSSGSTPARLGIGSTGQVLTVAGGVPTWATPAGGGGKVLQVVSGSTTTTTTITSASFTDTGIALSITPTSASSKILVFINGQMRHNRSAMFSQIGGQITRNGSAILTWNIPDFSAVETGNGTDVRFTNIMAMQYLDSPATTSSVEYKLQSAVSTGSSASVIYQRGNGPSVITLMEIGA